MLIFVASWAWADVVVADELVRHYEDGPLSREDFQGEVPRQRKGFDAVVHTRLHYDYSYDQRTNGEKYEVRCTSVSCCSEVLPRRSWITPIKYPNLLDHEQGHFDLAEITAHKAQARLRDLVREQRLRGKGATEAEAKTALNARIEAILKRFDHELAEANRLYDEFTDHGRVGHRQRLARKKQEKELALLNSEVKGN